MVLVSVTNKKQNINMKLKIKLLTSQKINKSAHDFLCSVYSSKTQSLSLNLSALTAHLLQPHCPLAHISHCSQRLYLIFLYLFIITTLGGTGDHHLTLNPKAHHYSPWLYQVLFTSEALVSLQPTSNRMTPSGPGVTESK